MKGQAVRRITGLLAAADQIVMDDYEVVHQEFKDPNDDGIALHIERADGAWSNFAAGRMSVSHNHHDDSP